MKKKLLSVVLSICLTVGVAVPAAAEDAVTIENSNVTVSEDINTDAQVGAQATSTSADAGITAENITVNNEGDGQAGGNVAGAQANACATGRSAEITAEDITVNASNVSNASGAEALAGEQDGASAAIYADDVTINVTNPVASGTITGILANVNSNESSALAEIGGDVKVNAGTGATGVLLKSNNGVSGANMSVKIDGDLISSGAGVSVEEVNGRGTTAEVLVQGTLTATGGPAILIDSDTSAGSVSVTAWKVESGIKNLVMEKTSNGGNQASGKADLMERSIRYIIKVDASQTDNIQIANGTQAFSYTSPHDNNTYSYDVARAGTKVGVKLAIPSGYHLKAAYSDEGRNINLLKDNDGSYYLIVPKGGGVLISMELEEDEQRKRKEDNNGDNTLLIQPQTAAGSSLTYKDGYFTVDLGDSDSGVISMKDLMSVIQDNPKVQKYGIIVFQTKSGLFVINISQLIENFPSWNVGNFDILSLKLDKNELKIAGGGGVKVSATYRKPQDLVGLIYESIVMINAEDGTTATAAPVAPAATAATAAQDYSGAAQDILAHSRL